LLFCMTTPCLAVALGNAFEAQGEYIGSDTCLDCHGEAVKVPYEKTPMGHRFTTAPQGGLQKKNCESCHGPGGKHAEQPMEKGLILAFAKTEPLELQNAACLQCHTADTKRHWENPPAFAKTYRCAECHISMKPSALVRGA